MQVQPGDILFQDLDCGPLCNAIESVTEGVGGRDFSHCAMVVRVNDSLKVVEAIGDRVQINSLEKFFARSGDLDTVKNIVSARLKPEYRNLIPAAAGFSLNQAGKPYDEEFVLDNGSWYCSELLYEAFRSANGGNPVFSLEPMTYKNPATGEFDAAWVEYYKKLNKPIPEGKPGINPGLISRYPGLEIINIQKP